MGLLTSKDARLFRSFFKEAARLRGMPAKYRYPVVRETTTHEEPQHLMSEDIDMDIIFIENPSITTLRTFGWVSETPDDKPILVQLPYDAPNIGADCQLSLPPIDSVGRPRDFRITAIKVLYEFPDCWTCSLAPIFDNKIVSTDYENTDYNYLKTDQTPYNESIGNRKIPEYGIINSDKPIKRSSRYDIRDKDPGEGRGRDQDNGILL